MRLKYPHIAVGALASSAPILQFEDIVPPETFYNLVSNDFKVIPLAQYLPLFFRVQSSVSLHLKPSPFVHFVIS